MRNAARRANTLHIEALFQIFTSVPQALPSSQQDRHDYDVEVIDQVGGEELADRSDSSSDADVETVCRLSSLT